MSGTSKTLSTITKSDVVMANGIMTGLAWSGTITYAFPTSASDYAYTEESSQGFAAISQAQQTAALFALEVDNGNSADDGFSIEGFTLSTFESGAGSSATLRFAESTKPATAYAYLPTTDTRGGDTWFGTGYDYTAPQAGNYAWHTMLHELGHALGLKHAHEKSGSFGLMAAANDDVEYTVMSYKAYVGANVKTGYTYASTSAPQTYMMADIAALQRMYGADYTTNSGNTVYKWSPNSGDTLVNGEVAIDAAGNVIFATIWDGGGNDTYDLTDYSTDLKLNLDAGKSSYFNVDQIAVLGNKKYATGNIYNALLYNKDNASLIENAFGGSGNDTINGNLLDNILSGGLGNDKIYGFAGNDQLYGNGGNNYIDGGIGNDTISVDGSGNNTLLGGAGDDVYYAFQNSGTNIITDTLGNNDITGGDLADTIKTGAGNDVIAGGDGLNVISAGAGNDTVSGGNDSDKINGEAGLNVISGSGGNDTLLGGAQNDTIYGGDDADTINGGAGNDDLWGGFGNDTIVGGVGNDTMYGGDGDDKISDTAGINFISGGNGTDTLMGGAQNDTIYGGADGDVITGGAGANFLYGDAGTDTITGGALVDTIDGGEDADVLLGGAGNDTISGGGGADSIRGGVGNDTMTGGYDADSFLFDTIKTMGKDVLTDFNYTADTLHFDLATMATSFESLAKQVGSDVVVSFAATAILTIKNFDLANIDEIVFV